MSLSAEEIELLRESMQRIAARKEAMADAFYRNLFVVAPETRPLFRIDIEEQTEKVMLALGAVVGRIHAVEAFRPMVTELALRHVEYGVEAGHYASVREALMRTLEEVFGESFEPAVMDVWRKAYDEISGVMVAAAYPKRPQMVA